MPVGTWFNLIVCRCILLHVCKESQNTRKKGESVALVPRCCECLDGYASVHISCRFSNSHVAKADFEICSGTLNVLPD